MNLFLKVLGALFLLLCTFLLTFFIADQFLFHLCNAKVLPWSFCGDLTGIIYIAYTSIAIALLGCVPVGATIYLSFKKRV